MESTTQQYITENKKPQMYVSWKRILLSSIQILFFIWVFSVAILLAFDYSFASEAFIVALISKGSLMLFFFVVPFSSILAILVSLFLIGSVFQEPKGYVRTKFVDSIFVYSALILVLILFIASFLFQCWYGHCAPSPFSLILDSFNLVIPAGVALIIGVVSVLYMNRKFQKSKAELGITQS